MLRFLSVLLMHRLLSARICVLIIGHDELIREGLYFLVSRLMPNATIVVAHPDDNIDPRRLAVGLVLYLLGAPYLAGIDNMRALRSRYPDASLVALSDSTEDYLLKGAVASHACGFLMISDDVASFAAALADVLAGRRIFPEGKSPRAARASDAPALHRARLTPRQREVYEYLRAGKTNKEIGALLKLSDNTVRTHVSAILKALNATNRTEASKLEKLFIRD